MTTGPETALPVVALERLVVFPGAVLPVELRSASSLRLAKGLPDRGARLLAALSRNADVEDPPASDLHDICVEAELERAVKVRDRVVLILRGIERRRIVAVTRQAPVLMATSEPAKATNARGIYVEGLAMSVRDAARKADTASATTREALDVVVVNEKDPGRLSDIIAAVLLRNLSADQRASLLCQLDVTERLHQLVFILRRP